MLARWRANTNSRRKKTTLRWFFFVQVKITWKLPKRVQQQVQRQMHQQQVQQLVREQQQEQLILFYRKRPKQLQR